MMENGYSVEEMENFKENAKTINFKDDKSLPPGWKCGVVVAGRGTRMHKYLSPGGDIFNNRATAVAFMMTNKSSEEDIEKMKAGLKQDGWSYDMKLPNGWMKKELQAKNTVIYLSPSLHTLRKKQQVIQYMETNGYESSEINKMKEYLKVANHNLYMH